jgi:hypothetical protein
MASLWRSLAAAEWGPWQASNKGLKRQGSQPESEWSPFSGQILTSGVPRPTGDCPAEAVSRGRGGRVGHQLAPFLWQYWAAGRECASSSSRCHPEDYPAARVWGYGGAAKGRPPSSRLHQTALDRAVDILEKQQEALRATLRSGTAIWRPLQRTEVEEGQTTLSQDIPFATVCMNKETRGLYDVSESRHLWFISCTLLTILVILTAQTVCISIRINLESANCIIHNKNEHCAKAWSSIL